MSTKKSKGFTAFDLEAEVNGAAAPSEVAQQPKPVSRPNKPTKAKLERVQRAIYFPKDLDDELRRWAFEDETQVTKLVVQAVREMAARREKK